ncbi:MAG TPA: hypothetical protein DGL25_06095 [Dehalococcoidia bacterium]|nr:hypothetical protein [Dehalococcoidia bacterium]
MAVDVVCGVEVAEGDVDAVTGQVPGGAPELGSGNGAKRFYQGLWYYFCSLECRLKFMATPDEFIKKGFPGG